jgi:hypothetical protein
MSFTSVLACLTGSGAVERRNHMAANIDFLNADRRN